MPCCVERVVGRAGWWEQEAKREIFEDWTSVEAGKMEQSSRLHL